MTEQPPEDQSAEDVRREFVHDWLLVASVDMDTAETLLAGGPKTYTWVAVLCQQAVEKLIKAVLVYHQIAVPRTHDTDMLLSLPVNSEKEFVDRNRDSRGLSQFAVTPRYPGGFAEMEFRAAQAIYRLAQRVQADVLDLLAPFLEEE